MQGILYEEPTVWSFLVITVMIGGWIAWMTGRGTALTWAPYWQAAVSLVLMGFAVRFLHFALFGGTLLSPYYYVVDTIVLLILGTMGFRATRASQMTTQYRWMYERTGFLSWRERARA